MKNLIMIFFFLTEILFSQSDLIRRNTNEYNSKKEHKLALRNIKNFKNLDKNKEIYISNLSPKKTILNKIENSESYVYDIIIKQWNTESSKWENSEHYLNTYDNQFNELESIYQIWDSGNNSWINAERYTSEYDENGNWISYLCENWNINQWTKYFLYSTSYNSQNLITEDLLQIWNEISTKWENYILYKYEYDIDWNNIIYLRQDWNYNSFSWENAWQHVGQFNNNLLTQDLFQEWNNDWQNSTLTEYSYDEKQNITEQIIKIWLDNSTWGNSSYHIFVYDENNNNSEYYYNYWDDSLSTWVTWYRDLYTYDENNNQIGYFSEDWNNLDSVWINYEQAFFSYNDQGFLISELYQSWDSDLSDWVYSTKIDYVITQSPTNVNLSNFAEISLFKLEQNYPNPFNPETTISYTIPTNPKNNVYSAQLFVYDILGRKIVELVNEKKSPGNYKINFDASKYASGIYYTILKIGNNQKIIKMQLLK